MQSTPLGFGASNTYAGQNIIKNGLRPGAWNSFAGYQQEAAHAAKSAVHFGQTQNLNSNQRTQKSWMA